MPPQLRVGVHVAARVDENGDATIVRTWSLLNIGAVSIGLPRGLFYVDIAPGNVRVLSVTDGRGLSLPCFIDAVPPDKTRISCWFNVELAPRDRFVLHLTYEHPAYFCRLRSEHGWMITESFERQEFANIGAQVEEPMDLEYALRLADPRRRWLFIRNPFQDWLVGSPEQFSVHRDHQARELRYLMRLRSSQRSQEFQVLSLISSRALWASLVSGGFWTIAGATAGIALTRAFG